MANLRDIIYSNAKVSLDLKDEHEKLLTSVKTALSLVYYVEEGARYIDAYIDNNTNELVFTDFDNKTVRFPLSVFTEGEYIHGNGTEDDKIRLSKSLTSYSEGFKPLSNKSWRYNTNLTSTDAVLLANFTWSDGTSANSNITATRSNDGMVLDIVLQNTSVKTNCAYFNVNIKASTPGSSDYIDKININVPNPYYYVYNLQYTAPIIGNGNSGNPVRLSYNDNHFSVVNNQLNIKNFLKYYMGPAYWEQEGILVLHMLGMTEDNVGEDKIVIQNPYTGNIIVSQAPQISGESQYINLRNIDLESDFVLVYAENVNHKMVSDAIVLPVYKS